jgi:apolipoprotein N-acyltransferase
MVALDTIAARPRLAAPLLGGLAACGFQPLSLWPLTLLAVAVLAALVQRAPSGRQAALTGWLFGLGHFTVGNGWIATSFTYQANMPEWLGWIAVVGVALYLAVWPALAALGGWWLGRRSLLALAPALAGSWIISEWLRAVVFSGFAWNPLGAVLLGDFAHPGAASLAVLVGTYGLSGGVVLLSVLLLAAVLQPRRWVLTGAALAALGGLALMLHGPAAKPGAEGSVAYTLVQPDIRQDVLNDPANFENQFVKTARLSLPRDPAGRRLVLWPESGVPDYLRGGYPFYFYRQTTFAADPLLARRRIGRVIGSGGLLLTGATDLDVRQGAVTGAHNVVTALDGEGAIRASYAKAHLVPYGEYVPLRWLLEPLGIARLVPGDIDFKPGPGPRTLDLGPWGKAGVQICYEIVFSGQVVDRAHRPDYLFNPSNDGWFGSWGPPQHLAQARLRAIEEGLPVLRATTTGISAVIDAQGVVRAAVPRHQAGRLDGLIPPPAPPTPFARAGNIIPLVLGAILLVLSRVAMRRKGS